MPLKKGKEERKKKTEKSHVEYAKAPEREMKHLDPKIDVKKKK
jgi:hypothetical protein